MAEVKNEKFVVLNDGNRMPLLGLGCWLSKADGETEAAVEYALSNGYSHVDTAYIYMNEEDVGKGIQKWLRKSEKNKRENIFVVTKLPLNGMHSERVEKFLKISLKRLNLSYVDLFLVHNPIGVKYISDDDGMPKTPEGKMDFDPGTDHIDIWKAMEKMVNAGLTKSIGVSNFTIKQIRKLIAIARIPPSVNQVEMHLNFQQREMVEFCKQYNVVVTAYSTLGSPGRVSFRAATGIAIDPVPLMDNPVVKLVADNHKVTTAQVLVKFFIQQGVVTIPKSVNPERIKSNGDVYSFTLSPLEMEALKLLDQGEKGRSIFYTKLGFEDHPECPF